MCKAAMAAAERPDEKRLGLTQLAAIPHVDALKLAQALCREKDVRAEAELACIGIAVGLREPHVDAAKDALKQLAADAHDKRIREEAAKALEAIERKGAVEYIPAWLVCGPYRQQGKECKALFDIEFPPETRAAAGVVWRPAPRPSAPAQAWQVDLGKIVGGTHCVVYLKARVSAPRAQKVRLDITSDDGIKLWVNGKLAHANNAIRGVTRDQDKAQATLRQGWNDVLVKITQHTMGCAAAVRIRNPDGSPIKGLRCW